MIRRALLNLVLNAIDVMPDGGDLVITSYDGARGFELEVADSGPGLSDEDETPRLRAVLHHEAKRHRPGPGDRVPRRRSPRRHGHRDELPRRRRRLHDQDSSPQIDASCRMSAKPRTTKRFRVLVVDDHASARESVADVLRHAGYDVAACASAIEALGQARASARSTSS